MRKVLKVIGGLALGLVLLVVVLLGAALGYRAWRVHQRAVETALHGPFAIQEARFVRIGGLDQWISIRGQDRRNPVLLVVHGGPGGSMVPNQYLLRSWERDFTVVQWDQRGAGKTFSRAGADGTGKLSLDLIAGDGLQVADWLRAHLHKAKLVLVGHSWGTMVASEMARRRPDLFSAYVGTGVVVDAVRGEAMGYQMLARRVRADGDGKALADLQRIGPPPYKTMADLFAERRILFAHPPVSERDRQARQNNSGLFEPELSLRDGYLYSAAEKYSEDQLYDAIIHYDAYARGVSFQCPVFVFQGAEDAQTATPLAVEYFNRLQAPHKELALLPGGGHFAITSEPALFLKELDARVRPLALAADAAATPRP
ncbi:MAG TPA: alpha/beta fold hydrolase [Phenylobacterium sp.]|nr:alpha/beta fold hydrolase [Phenylobacterium sp.]